MSTFDNRSQHGFPEPTAQDSFNTGAAALDLSGAASAYGEPITQVRWTSTLTRAPALASGTTNWIAEGIPLQRGTNPHHVLLSSFLDAPKLIGFRTF